MRWSTKPVPWFPCHKMPILYNNYIRFVLFANVGKYFSLLSLKNEKSYPLGPKVYSCVYPLYKISRHVWLIRHETCLIYYAWMYGNHIFTQLSICHKMSMANYPKRCRILTTLNINDFWLNRNILLLFTHSYCLLRLKEIIYSCSYPNM